jgi:DNA replication protein DnaC
VRVFAREFPLDKRPGLLLIGDPGTGKTHLAVAAMRILMSRGFEGLFFDYQNLLDKIRAGFDAASGASDREAYRAALDAEVLLLEFGAHRVTDWVLDTVTAIITYRCNNRKPLIATSNLPGLTPVTLSWSALPPCPGNSHRGPVERRHARAIATVRMCRVVPPLSRLPVPQAALR